MRVPLSWLRESVPFEVEPSKLAEDLTAAGLAVDAVETVGGETVLELTTLILPGHVGRVDDLGNILITPE